MIRGEGRGLWFFEEKKDCSARSDKKVVCSANFKNKNFVHNTVRKMGLYEGKKLAYSFAWEITKVCFWLGAKNKKMFAQGKKTIASTPHVPSGPPLRNTPGIAYNYASSWMCVPPRPHWLYYTPCDKSVVLNWYDRACHILRIFSFPCLSCAIPLPILYHIC